MAHLTHDREIHLIEPTKEVAAVLHAWHVRHADDLKAALGEVGVDIVDIRYPDYMQMCADRTCPDVYAWETKP